MNNDFENRIRQHMLITADLLRDVAGRSVQPILDVVALVAATFERGGKLLLCGNGGSAADCQHIAAELVSRLSKEFERPGLPAIALTTDTSFLTAFANDCGYEGVFARQVEALGREGDVLIGISTSGRSPNVIRAVEAARKRGMKTVALLGASGPLRDHVDHPLIVPSENTQHIQEAMLSIEHIVCELVERALYAPRPAEIATDASGKRLP